MKCIACKQEKASIIFLTCIFLCGFLAVFSYGAHLDQDSEQEILYSNIKMYLRYWEGGENTFCRDLESQGINDIADSIEKDHGMAVYYPVCWIFYLNQISPYAGNIIWHIYIYLLTFCGVLALFYLIQELFGNLKVSTITTAMFFFTPRMFAESHYNNKDMILLSLVLVIFYSGQKIIIETSWKWVIIFSLSGSLAANMKIIGVFIWGIIGVYILAVMLYRHRFREIYRKLIVCIGLMLLFYIAFTPACWGDFWGFERYLLESAKNFRWNDYILFNGNLYNKNITGMPRSYLPVMMLLSVPPGILLLGITGAVSMVFSLAGKPAKFFGFTGYVFIMALAGLIPVGYAVVAGTPVYNGWRHFYFCYASIIVLLAQGVSVLMEKAAIYNRGKMAAAVFGIYVVFLAGGILINHPYEYAYYNFLAGKDIENTYELDYWDMSFKQAYKFVLKQTDNENIQIGTVSNPAYWGLESQLYAVRGKQRMRITLCDDWRDAQYLIINPMYAYMYGEDDYEYIIQNYVLLDSIEAYGNTICEIYRK